MPEKQLELSKRNAFFKDPFFKDMVSGVGDGLEKRLAEFSARSMGVSGVGLNEAAHNIQVSASNDKFMIQLELPGFAPEDFSLRVDGPSWDLEQIKLHANSLNSPPPHNQLVDK